MDFIRADLLAKYYDPPGASTISISEHAAVINMF